MVEVKNLTKRYGSSVAVDDVSFTAESGEILGFLGPNGAGKSTTMNIITGYLSSNSGTVTVDGCEILEDPNGAKSKIGYLPEIPPLYIDMKVKEYLSFMFDLKRVRLPKQKHLEEVCTVARITDVSNRLIRNLSKGYRQRVGLAQALIGNPPVLILDEPTVGLDPQQIIEMRTLIKGLGKKHTVILSSHILSEIEATCDRVIVINKGKLVADARTSDITRSLAGSWNLMLQVEGSETAVVSAIKTISDVSRVRKMRTVDRNSNEYLVEPTGNIDIRKQVFNVLSNANLPILMMKNAELSLEEAFLKLTNTDSLISAEKGGSKK